MAIRYCGNVKINIRWKQDREYVGSVSAGGIHWRFKQLYSPASGFPYAADESAAYDRMAESAVDFACHYEDEKPVDCYLGEDDANIIASNCDYDEHGEPAIVRRK